MIREAPTGFYANKGNWVADNENDTFFNTTITREDVDYVEYCKNVFYESGGKRAREYEIKMALTKIASLGKVNHENLSVFMYEAAEETLKNLYGEKNEKL